MLFRDRDVSQIWSFLTPRNTICTLILEQMEYFDSLASKGEADWPVHVRKVISSLIDEAG